MTDDRDAFRRADGPGRWKGVDVLAYKADGEAPFKDITRQVLFGASELPCELRYFEIAPGGHSTLERHEHVHAVMIFRGKGRCMLANKVVDVGLHDLVSIPPMTWHQFRAGPDEPLGFLCMVNRERDRPQLPTQAEREAMRAEPAVAAFLDGK
jgi:quercetin dioxygenase-like cupin family protein